MFFIVRKRGHSEASLAQTGLLDIKNLTEHQPQTKLLCSHDKNETKQGYFIIVLAETNVRSQCNPTKYQISFC